MHHDKRSMSSGKIRWIKFEPSESHCESRKIAVGWRDKNSPRVGRGNVICNQTSKLRDGNMEVPRAGRLARSQVTDRRGLAVRVAFCHSCDHSVRPPSRELDISPSLRVPSVKVRVYPSTTSNSSFSLDDKSMRSTIYDRKRPMVCLSLNDCGINAAFSRAKSHNLQFHSRNCRPGFRFCVLRVRRSCLLVQDERHDVEFFSQCFKTIRLH